MVFFSYINSKIEAVDNILLVSYLFREAVAEKLRTISQFQTASEHNNLINSIVRERELRTRIRELLR